MHEPPSDRVSRNLKLLEHEERVVVVSTCPRSCSRVMDADLLDALDRQAPSSAAAPGPVAMTVRDESESVQRDRGKLLATVREREREIAHPRERRRAPRPA